MKKILTLLVFSLATLVSKSQVTYTINSIPYTPDPYNVGTNLGLTLDDIFSSVQPIGFSFSFFGINYDSIVVSSNGSISFNTSKAGLYSQWMLDTLTIPSTAPMLSDLRNSILAPYQDLNPATSTPGVYDIKIALKGVAPYRRLVVSFDSVSLFSCTSYVFSNQIILYETTNYIDINIQNKPICTGWNGGNAILGIEDSSGTVAYSPANRNGNSQWSTSNESWRFIPSNAGSANPNSCKVKGTIFFDGNANCSKDAGEYGNMNRYVLTDIGSYYAYTDIDGNYEMMVDTGNYIVSHNPYGTVSVLCPPSNSYPVSFSVVNDSISNIDFGDSTQICSDLYSTAGVCALRYCHTNFVTVPYGNLGSIPENNAILTVTIPDSTIASNFSITPTSVVGNVYTFNLGTLVPGQMSFLTFNDSVICDTNWIGSNRCFYTSITGTNVECDASNNIDTICFTVVASFDPNNKEAMVEHLPTHGFVENGIVLENEWITYKVNFQNTGSAAALNIVVKDMLDANTLDTNTVQFIGSSHLCTMLRNGNQLNFMFDGINLIDSNHNEAMSHGWLMFKVKSLSNFPIGITPIINTAGIYFDNNPVVNTNANTLNINNPEFVSSTFTDKEINVYPNPMTKSSEFHFAHTLKNATLNVLNSNGQIVFSDIINGTTYTLQRKQLASGIYMVQIHHEEGKLIQLKLSVQ